MCRLPFSAALTPGAPGVPGAQWCPMVPNGSPGAPGAPGGVSLVGSPYRTPINSAVLKLQEMGQLYKIKKKWWKEKRGGGTCEVTLSSFCFFPTLFPFLRASSLLAAAPQAPLLVQGILSLVLCKPSLW